MPRQADLPTGVSHNFKHPLFNAHHSPDGRCHFIGSMPGLGVPILPDGTSGPAGWRAFGLVNAKAGFMKRTELSGAVPPWGITPSEFLGVCAKELTGFARGIGLIRGGYFETRTNVGKGLSVLLTGGAA